MHRVLIVSASAPPKTGPESLQTFKYIKYLQRHFEVILVTTNPQKYGWKKKDPYLDIKIDKIEINVIKNRFLNSFFNKVFHNNKFSEESIFLRSENLILSRLKKEVDIIYSRSTPFVSAKLALKLKNKLKVPWVMHLSDPWCDSTYGEYTESELNWEQKCFEFADLISFTSQKSIDFYKDKYTKFQRKFLLSPNSFDPDDRYEYRLQKSEKLKLLFTGNQYLSRNCLPIIEAIKMLPPQDQGVIILEMIGHVHDVVRAEVNKSNIHFAQLKESISYKYIQEEVSKSHVLVSIDKPVQEMVDLVYLPSKLSDYLLAQRKILNVSGRGSASSDLVKGSIGKSFEHHDVEQISQYLSKCISEWRANNMEYFVTEFLDERFNVEANVLNLKKHIERVINK